MSSNNLARFIATKKPFGENMADDTARSLLLSIRAQKKDGKTTFEELSPDLRRRLAKYGIPTMINRMVGVESFLKAQP